MCSSCSANNQNLNMHKYINKLFHSEVNIVMQLLKRRVKTEPCPLMGQTVAFINFQIFRLGDMGPQFCHGIYVYVCCNTVRFLEKPCALLPLSYLKSCWYFLYLLLC